MNMAHYFNPRVKRDLTGGAESIHLPSLAEAVQSFKGNGDMILPTRAYGAYDSDTSLSPDQLREPREYDMDKFDAAVLERTIAAENRRPKPEKFSEENNENEGNPEGAQ